jgi:hypothetical protein
MQRRQLSCIVENSPLDVAVRFCGHQLGNRFLFSIVSSADWRLPQSGKLALVRHTRQAVVNGGGGCGSGGRVRIF